ncbi:MAG: B-box zinc finger protein [Acidimicrobiales bacterium]
MTLTCNRHSFEYAENVCSKCGIAFCHDCLVYPRGTKKPPLCVPCAIAAAGVRSSARNQSNLSRREVKKRVREAKGLQQPQPYVEAPAVANTERDFELTSNASFDQGWAVSWDEGRDPHPGYPEPVRVTWGSDPFATPEAVPAAPSAIAPAAPAPAAPAPAAELPAPVAPAPAPPVVVAAPEPAAAPRTELPRLQPMNLSPGHAPARPGGLPSVRPPLKPATGEAAPPARKPLGGVPATRPDAPAAATPSAAPAGGRLRRKASGGANESSEMLDWIDGLIGSDKGQSPSGSQSG